MMNRTKPHTTHKKSHSTAKKSVAKKTQKRAFATLAATPALFGLKKQKRAFSTAVDQQPPAAGAAAAEQDATSVEAEQIKQVLLVKPKIDFKEVQLDDLTQEQKDIIQQQSDNNIELGADLYLKARADPSFSEAFTAHTETPFPFLYRFLTNEGESFGGPKPTWRDTIKIHYQVALPDGTVLDDSGIAKTETAPPIKVNLMNPSLAGLGAVVAGLGLLSEGDIIQLVLPALSQGKQFHPQHPNAPLLWTILRADDAVDNTGDDVRAAGAAYYAKHQSSGEYTEHPAGFLYKYNQPAVEGQPRPSPNSTCLVHYEGRTTTGEVFDSSYKRGQPTPFPLGQVVAGFREAISGVMSVGDKITVILPPELAYGDQTVSPQIPGGSTLTFDIELIKF